MLGYISLLLYFFFFPVLPFLKNPEQNPGLEMYFSSLWQETFPLSLHNFLNAIFQSMRILLIIDVSTLHSSVFISQDLII